MLIKEKIPVIVCFHYEDHIDAYINGKPYPYGEAIYALAGNIDILEFEIKEYKQPFHPQ